MVILSPIQLTVGINHHSLSVLAMFIILISMLTYKTDKGMEESLEWRKKEPGFWFLVGKETLATGLGFEHHVCHSKALGSGCPALSPQGHLG